MLCYQDSLRFETDYQEEFLRTAQHYDPDYAALCQELTLTPYQKLAFFGIYTQPELFEFSGPLLLRTRHGIMVPGNWTTDLKKFVNVVEC